MKSSKVKTEFLSRIEDLTSTLTESPTSNVLTSIIPLGDSHNTKAKILRNGIAITAFVVLEDFLKNRTGEILNGINHSANNFNTLNEELKSAVTIEALDSIRNRANNMKRSGENWLSFVQEETKKISSSGGVRYKFSNYSLGWNKSNIIADDIAHWLKVFSVSGGWGTIQKITQKAEVTLVAPKSTFQNIALNRHSAAHDPKHEILFSDLLQFLKDAKALALSYDSLLSKSLKEINSSNHALLNGTQTISDADISFRYIIKDGKFWKEYKNTSKRALKRSTDIHEAIKLAKIRAKVKGEIILVKDNANSIKDWIYT